MVVGVDMAVDSSGTTSAIEVTTTSIIIEIGTIIEVVLEVEVTGTAAAEAGIPTTAEDRLIG